MGALQRGKGKHVWKGPTQIQPQTAGGGWEGTHSTTLTQFSTLCDGQKNKTKFLTVPIQVTVQVADKTKT